MFGLEIINSVVFTRTVALDLTNRHEYSFSGDVVFDPFLGSGTVLDECARIGLRAYGTKINPAAYFISKIFETCNLDIEKRQGLVNSIDNDITNLSNYTNPEDMLNAILTLRNVDSNYISNVFSLIIILLDLYKNNLSQNSLVEKWKKLRIIILNLPYSNAEISVFNCDARKTPLPNNIVDLVITSPPYINVFNYHQQYRRSVEVLGYDVLNIAKSEFGSNRKNRGNRFLTVIQYCLDISLILKEILRVSKRDARCIIVVGRESSVLGVKISNSELIYNLATRIFGLEIIMRQERLFKNKFGVMIYEDILHFNCQPTNDSINELDDERIIAGAKAIAKEALCKQLTIQTVKIEVQESIQLAIKSIDNVHISELHEIMKEVE
jgi:hypothetical protein